MTPIILGIDPGTRVTGYALLRKEERRFILLDYGCVRPPASLKLSDRYLVLFNAVDRLIELHAPTELAVESQFIPDTCKKNIQGVLKLGMARGIALIAAKKRGLRVFEYSPAEAKKAVVGNGRASKSQVQGMVKSLLALSLLPPEDAADALALAICHFQSIGSLGHSIRGGEI